MGITGGNGTKTDNSVKFCVDYRALNSVTQFDAYPMPQIDDIIRNLGNCSFISTLDLTKGFWQVELSKKAQEKTAFVTPYGLFQVLVLPFGLQNASATFQRLI